MFLHFFFLRVKRCSIPTCKGRRTARLEEAENVSNFFLFSFPFFGNRYILGGRICLGFPSDHLVPIPSGPIGSRFVGSKTYGQGAGRSAGVCTCTILHGGARAWSVLTPSGSLCI